MRILRQSAYNINRFYWLIGETNSQEDNFAVGETKIGQCVYDCEYDLTVDSHVAVSSLIKELPEENVCILSTFEENFNTNRSPLNLLLMILNMLSYKDRLAENYPNIKASLKGKIKDFYLDLNYRLGELLSGEDNWNGFLDISMLFEFILSNYPVCKESFFKTIISLCIDNQLKDPVLSVCVLLNLAGVINTNKSDIFNNIVDVFKSNANDIIIDFQPLDTIAFIEKLIDVFPDKRESIYNDIIGSIFNTISITEVHGKDKLFTLLSDIANLFPNEKNNIFHAIECNIDLLFNNLFTFEKQNYLEDVIQVFPEKKQEILRITAHVFTADEITKIKDWLILNFKEHKFVFQLTGMEVKQYFIDENTNNFENGMLLLGMAAKKTFENNRGISGIPNRLIQDIMLYLKPRYLTDMNKIHKAAIRASRNINSLYQLRNSNTEANSLDQSNECKKQKSM